MTTRTALCLAALTASALAQTSDPWFSTFSIIAWNQDTKELGVAVESRAFGAGAAVPYAIPGVGAIATQAAANRLYGAKAIALLQKGMTPAEVVKQITDEDPGRDSRQVAVIDVQGRSAVFTGKTTLTHVFAGHVTGTNFSVQGNTLAGEEVVKAVAATYQSTKGSMAERFMAALEAGQSEGGDRRGMQSAGILIVRPIPPGSDSTVERVVDIRVDDAVDPFKELRRLLNLTMAGTHSQQSALLAKESKFAEALAEQKQAAEMNPRNEGTHYALAQRYTQNHEFVNAIVELREALTIQKNLREQAAADPIFAPLHDFVEFKRLVQTP
jgi:uncharacterized Ntn-hydrolase superfamily protein